MRTLTVGQWLIGVGGGDKIMVSSIRTPMLIQRRVKRTETNLIHFK